MATGANDQRRFLTTGCPVLKTCEVVGKYLHRVNKIIEVLNFGDGSESPKCETNALPHDGTFADARIGYAKLTKFFLQSRETLVYVADLPNVFAKSEHQRISFQCCFETCTKNLATVDNIRGL